VDFDIAERLPPDLGHVFREFYSGQPWNERWRCHVCSPAGDFGPRGSSGLIDATHCPVHPHVRLEEYWSDSRVAEYLQAAMSKPESWVIIGRASQRVVAWAWGYSVRAVPELRGVPAGGTYADIVMVMPEYRSRYVMEFFRQSQELLRSIRYPYILCRTSVDARNVHMVLGRLGWVRLSESITPCETPRSLRSEDDPSREYWMLRL